MNIKQEYIKDLLELTGAHTVFYGKKTVNGQETDDYCLVHAVEKKLKHDEIPAGKIIPKTIKFEGEEHKTDVIEMPVYKTSQCNSLTDTSVLFLQSRHRPLSGGLEISNLATWKQISPYYFTARSGTLGFIAVDNVDNKLVGVTCSHVAVLDFTVTSERDVNLEITSTLDKIYFTDGGFYGIFDPTILQYDKVGGNVNFILDKIGATKRYIPIALNSTNTVDVALIGLDAGTADVTSAQQAELVASYAMPFATTQELDDLQLNNIPIYSVGKTTGLKGTTCPLQVFGHGSTKIAYNKQGTLTDYIVSNVIFCRFVDQSNLPAYEGDSGSAVIGNFNGTYKILGVLFGANTSVSQNGTPQSTSFVFCRIDEIASKINISAWDGQNLNFGDTSLAKANTLYRPSDETRTQIDFGGRTYYQVGLKLTSEGYTNI